MLIISEPAKGATSLIFKNKEDLEYHIEGLQKLLKVKEFPGETYPAVYTCLPIPSEEASFQDHIDKCKRINS